MKKYRFKIGDYFHFKNEYWNIFGVVERIYEAQNGIKFGFRYIQCDKKINDKNRFYLGSSMYNNSRIFKNKEEAFLEML